MAQTESKLPTVRHLELAGFLQLSLSLEAKPLNPKSPNTKTVEPKTLNPQTLIFSIASLGQFDGKAKARRELV